MDWVQYPNHDIRGPIILIEVGIEFSFCFGEITGLGALTRFGELTTFGELTSFSEFIPFYTQIYPKTGYCLGSSQQYFFAFRPFSNTKLHNLNF